VEKINSGKWEEDTIEDVKVFFAQITEIGCYLTSICNKHI